MSGEDSGSEKSTLNLVSKTHGGRIAKLALERGVQDYEKLRTRELLKTALQERDTELKAVSMDHQAQADRIRALRCTVSAKNREIAQLKQTNKESTARANKLTDALLVEKNKTALIPSNEDQEMSDMSETASKPEPEPRPGTSADNDVPTPKSYVEEPCYQEAVQNVDLDSLDMAVEAANMMSAADITVTEGVKFRYPVPTHLIGLIVGRQKVTLRRICNQTSTEIEQCSWAVTDGTTEKRQMGFTILGSPAAIREAVDEMVTVIKVMDLPKAIKLISGHIKKPRDTAKMNPTKKPSATTSVKPAKQPTGTSKSTTNSKKSGSKSKSKGQICSHYLKGQCRYGINCRKQHSKGH